MLAKNDVTCQATIRWAFFQNLAYTFGFKIWLFSGVVWPDFCIAHLISSVVKTPFSHMYLFSRAALSTVAENPLSGKGQPFLRHQIWLQQQVVDRHNCIHTDMVRTVVYRHPYQDVLDSVNISAKNCRMMSTDSVAYLYIVLLLRFWRWSIRKMTCIYYRSVVWSVIETELSQTWNFGSIAVIKKFFYLLLQSRQSNFFLMRRPVYTANFSECCSNCIQSCLCFSELFGMLRYWKELLRTQCKRLAAAKDTLL